MRSSVYPRCGDEVDGDYGVGGFGGLQELPAGCVQRWEKREAGWYGRIDPEKCRIWSKQRQTDLGIEAEVRVTADAYMTAERGFNDKGEKVFGTAPDEYYVLPRR